MQITISKSFTVLHLSLLTSLLFIDSLLNSRFQIASPKFCRVLPEKLNLRTKIDCVIPKHVFTAANVRDLI